MGLLSVVAQVVPGQRGGVGRLCARSASGGEAGAKPTGLLMGGALQSGRARAGSHSSPPPPLSLQRRKIRSGESDDGGALYFMQNPSDNKTCTKQQNNQRAFNPCWSLLPLIWTTCHCSSSTLLFLSRSCILSVTYRKQIKWTRTRSPQSLPTPLRVVQQSCPAEVGGGFGTNNRLTSFTSTSRQKGDICGGRNHHSQEERKKENLRRALQIIQFC